MRQPRVLSVLLTGCKTQTQVALKCLKIWARCWSLRCFLSSSRPALMLFLRLFRESALHCPKTFPLHKNNHHSVVNHTWIPACNCCWNGKGFPVCSHRTHTIMILSIHSKHCILPICYHLYSLTIYPLLIRPRRRFCFLLSLISSCIREIFLPL